MWFIQNCSLQDWGRNRDRDMDKWVVWFYVEPFTLHLNSDKTDTFCLSPIVLVPVLDTASVIGCLNLKLFRRWHCHVRLNS